MNRKNLSLFMCLPVHPREIQKKAVRKLYDNLDILLERFWDDPCMSLPITPFESIFISSLAESPEPSEINQLLSHSLLTPSKHAECTLEINLPLQESSGALHNAGINRISIKQLQAASAFPAWVEDWPGRLNLDIHLGEQLPDSLPSALGHLSLYGDGPSGKLKNYWELMESKGFRQYELCHFALEGQISRQIWNLHRMRPVLGVGPGAESTLPIKDSSGQIRILRRIEEQNSQRWLEQMPGMATEAWLEPNELMLEYFMLGLRLRSGLDSCDFLETFGRKPEDCIPSTVEKWIIRDWMELSSHYLKIKGKGFMLIDDVLQDIAHELAQRSPKRKTGKPERKHTTTS